MESDSHDLVSKTRDGDRAALADLVARHVDSLHGYLRLRIGPALRQHESSLDLVNSVCCEVLEGLSGFEYRGEAAFRGWLFEAAENKLRDRARYWGRAKRDAAREVNNDASASSALTCYASLCSPSEGAIVREEIARVERAFDELDERYKEVVLLNRVVGLSYEQIAARIGQTPHYTRTLLSRGIARLATLLDRA